MAVVDERRPSALVLLGATASGKTALGIEVAQRLGGEIISADSRAIFAGLEIVTDRPSTEERRGVLHHLIGTVPFHESYDAMAFRRDVKRLVAEIDRRGHIPLIVGGSTLYLEAILRGVFEGPSKDPAFRSSLDGEAAATLHRRLEAIDPAAAQSIHPNDRLRITRALEVYELTGRPISAWQREIEPLPIRFDVYGLARDRVEHRKAIAARVVRMLDRGLIEEVSHLREAGLTPGMQAYRTIGIPEVFDHLDGRATREEVEQAMVRHTWALARRQAAWFRRYKQIRWIDAEGAKRQDIASEVIEGWRRP